MKRLLTLLASALIVLSTSVAAGQGGWVPVEAADSELESKTLQYGSWILKTDRLSESGSGSSAELIAEGNVLLLGIPDISVRAERAVLSAGSVRFEAVDGKTRPRASVDGELRLSASEIEVELASSKVILVEPGARQHTTEAKE